MCFEVPTLVPLGGVGNGSKSRNNDDDTNDDDLGIMDIDDDDDDGKSGMSVFIDIHFTSLTFIQLQLVYVFLPVILGEFFQS